MENDTKFSETQRCVLFRCMVTDMADRIPDATRRNQRSRAAVLAAARELVTEVSYARLTVEAIAARAGVGKQTIYRWWPSKGVVVFDALLELSRTEGELVLPDTGDLRADLRMVLRSTIEELRDSRIDALYRAVFADVQSDLTLATQLTERLLDPLRDALLARLQKGIDQDQVDPRADLAVGVELLNGPVFHRWLLRTGQLDDGYADTVVDLALQALRPADRANRGARSVAQPSTTPT